MGINLKNNWTMIKETFIELGVMIFFVIVAIPIIILSMVIGSVIVIVKNIIKINE